MGKIRYSRFFKIVAAVCFILGAAFFVTVSTQTVKADTADGFQVIGGKTYYYKDGVPVKGWLTLNGKKYYFNSVTGEQLKGWAKNKKGQYRYFSKGDGALLTGWAQTQAGRKRYFTKGSGIMLTGWAQNQSGQKRYFSKQTGQMFTGWAKNSDGKYRYFSKNAGIMATGWLQDTKGNQRYFSKGSGIMATGWLQDTKGNRRYFNPSNGVMYKSKLATVGSVTYSFDEDGIATSVGSGNWQVDEASQKVLVYDSGHKRNYYVAKEYLTHPGIANNQVSDRDLLAAICDAEANDQGVVGMEAVALTILNRTLNTEFPSSIRYVIYDNTYGAYPQYSPVRDGALLRRLNGSFESKTQAYQAVDAALNIFNAYVTNGTKRKVPGFAKDDFDYQYFMTHAAFAAQSLDFTKVEAVQYGDHTFFVDWISG